MIELLVVVIIIGVLVAIAIPTFLSQRDKANEKAMTSDLRNAAAAGTACSTERHKHQCGRHRYVHYAGC